MRDREPNQDWKDWIGASWKSVLGAKRIKKESGTPVTVSGVEGSIRELSRYALAPSLFSPSTFKSSRFSRVAAKDGLPIFPVRANPSCLAASSIFRVPQAPNARLSSSDFTLSNAAEMLNGSSRAALGAQGSAFFSELYELYFAVFGRGNTLNEYFLDHFIPSHQPKGVECRLIVLDYEANYKDYLRAWFDDSVFHIRVSAEVAEVLTKGYELGKVFWVEAWESFRQMKDQAEEGKCGDWLPAALSRMSRRAVPLQGELSLARSLAEKQILSEAKKLVKSLDTMFKDDQTPCSEKLGRLLRMLQGNLCLVPWARIESNKHPCPVVLVPAITEDAHCSWTFVAAEPVNDLSAWTTLSPIAESAFGDVAPYYSAVLSGQAKAGEDKSLLTIAASAHTSKSESAKLRDLADQFQEGALSQNSIWELVTNLTGQYHEGRPCDFAFIYGPQEVLKHVERVVSNEYVADATRDVEDARSLSIRCSGHHSFFQWPHIAAFIDHSRLPFSINRMVLLRDPPAEDLETMQKDQILLDENTRMRWLIWRVSQRYHRLGEKPIPSKTPGAWGFVAGGDGILRVFFQGNLVLTWSKQVESDKFQMRLGIEYGRDATSAPAKLRGHIRKALDLRTADEPAVDDLVSTICTISNAPGEGAVFVFGGKQGETSGLSDMAPAHFKMEWAKDRRLLDTEQHILRSLAVMDGAVHISTGAKNQNGDVHWVSARRFISAQARNPERNGTGSEMLNADHIVRLFDNCITLLHAKPESLIAKQAKGEKDAESRCALLHRLGENLDQAVGHQEEMVETIERTFREWKARLGGRGTRHRSVLQLCIWNSENSRRGRVGFRGKNGISVGPLICTISADGPVNLYRMYTCAKRRKCSLHVDKERTVGCTGKFLWTEKVIG